MTDPITARPPTFADMKQHAKDTGKVIDLMEALKASLAPLHNKGEDIPINKNVETSE